MAFPTHLEEPAILYPAKDTYRNLLCTELFYS